MSKQVTVQFTPVTAVPLVGDTVLVRASLHDKSGAEVPNGQLAFSFSNRPGVELLGAGPRSVRAVLLVAGAQTITATAAGYGASPSAALTLQVKDALSIDSVRPTTARFGDTVLVYGTGLQPARLVGLFAGSRLLPTSGYVPADPGHPLRGGRLAAWMIAGMPLKAVIRAIQPAGVASAADTVTVTPEDLFEPNDTLPVALPVPFADPALAMEGRSRSDDRLTVDWYRVEQPPSQDLSVQWVLPREKLGGPLGALWVSDSVAGLYDQPRWAIVVSPDGVSTVCRGVSWTEPDVSDTVTMTFRRPAQRYDLQLSYVRSPSTSAYSLTTSTSLLTAIAPDAYESNDVCDDATALPLDSTALNLTIDRPTDFDWFKFSVGGAGDSVAFDAEFPAVNDLDVGIFQSFLPDSVTYLGCLCSGAPDQEVGYAQLPPGDYLAVVASYLTLPTPYRFAAKAYPQVVIAPFVGSQAAPAGTSARVRARGVLRRWLRARR